MCITIWYSTNFYLHILYHCNVINNHGKFHVVKQLLLYFFMFILYCYVFDCQFYSIFFSNTFLETY